MHTCTHAHIHTHTHTLKRTYTCTHAHMHTCTRTHTRTDLVRSNGISPRWVHRAWPNGCGQCRGGQQACEKSRVSVKKKEREGREGGKEASTTTTLRVGVRMRACMMREVKNKRPYGGVPAASVRTSPRALSSRVWTLPWLRMMAIWLTSSSSGSWVSPSMAMPAES